MRKKLSVNNIVSTPNAIAGFGFKVPADKLKLIDISSASERNYRPDIDINIILTIKNGFGYFIYDPIEVDILDLATVNIKKEELQIINKFIMDNFEGHFSIETFIIPI